LAPQSELTLKIKNKPHLKPIPLKHTLDETQIEWFKSGSALNWIRKSLN
jgi:aconitase A